MAPRPKAYNNHVWKPHRYVRPAYKAVQAPKPKTVSFFQPRPSRMGAAKLTLPVPNLQFMTPYKHKLARSRWVHPGQKWTRDGLGPWRKTTQADTMKILAMEDRSNRLKAWHKKHGYPPYKKK
jgi:hypothetical protein